MCVWQGKRTKLLTTVAFDKQFPDDEACFAHRFAVRFGQGFACPSFDHPSSWYRTKAERAYSCQWCHLTGGTPFEQTRTQGLVWFYAVHLFTTTRHDVRLEPCKGSLRPECSGLSAPCRRVRTHGFSASMFDFRLKIRLRQRTRNDRKIQLGLFLFRHLPNRAAISMLSQHRMRRRPAPGLALRMQHWWSLAGSNR